MPRHTNTSACNPMSQTKAKQAAQPPEKLNLLVVDSEAPRLFPKDSEMHEIFNLFIATSVDRAIALIKQHTIHIALCEEDLPDGRGSDLLVRMKNDHPGIIRILSAEKSNAVSMKEAINKANIFRFIEKPWGFEMRTILEETRQICLSRTRNQYTDTITSLRSTTAIYDILHSELTRSLRHKLTFSVLLVSITSPNEENKLHNFLVDRFLLKKIADILLTDLRDSDYAGRLKDNKFLVILPEADTKGAQNFMDRFQESIKKFEQEINQGLLPFKIISAEETVTGKKLVTENDLIATLYHKLLRGKSGRKKK